MEERYSRCVRHPASCEILIHGRAAGIIMAVPFVVCFTLFGVFNLVGGTVLTIMACKPKFPKGLELFQRLIKKTDLKLQQQQLDPMQVVGIILLLTGCMLVFIGISLGVVACRSVNDDRRRRNRLEEVSMSGVVMSTMAERSSRRTSTSTFSPTIPHRKNGRKKSFTTENIASPILEVDSEEDDVWANSKANDDVVGQSVSELQMTTTCRQNAGAKTSGSKVTWASDVGATNTIEVVAEVVQPSADGSPKMLLTTDL